MLVGFISIFIYWRASLISSSTFFFPEASEFDIDDFSDYEDDTRGRPSGDMGLWTMMPWILHHDTFDTSCI